MVSRREFLGLTSLSALALASYGTPIQSRELGGGDDQSGDEPPDGSEATPSNKQETPAQSDEDGGNVESGEKTPSGDAGEQTEQRPVLNVREYGAVGDGTVDDTGALQSAFDDASEGDTVYLPAGTYRVSAHHSTKQSAIALESYRHPENLILEGDGEDTVILMDGNHENVHIVLSVAVGDGYEGLTIRDLLINGNSWEQDGKFAHLVGNGLVIRDATEQAAGNIDIKVRNVKMKNAMMNGFRVLNGGVTLDHVSAVNNGRHGFALDSRSYGRVYDPPITVRNAYATGNGVYNQNGHGFDLSGGKVVLENAISEANYQGTKSTEEILEATYRRVLLSNNDRNGYIRPGSESVTGQRSTVTIEDVVAVENGSSGFRFGRDTDFDIGTAVAMRNGQDTDKQNIRIRDNAKVKADEVFSFDGSYGAGISCNSSQASRVDTYVHYNNPGGPLHLPGGQLDVQTSYRLPPSFFDTAALTGLPDVDVPIPNKWDVPSRSSVGVRWE